jgi:hypothetical protein
MVGRNLGNDFIFMGEFGLEPGVFFLQLSIR